MSLRIVLIVVGVVIIAGVWFATAVIRRRQARASFQRRFSRLDMPDVILDHTEDEVAETTDSPQVEAHALPTQLPPALRDIPNEIVLPPEQASVDDLPRVINDIEATEEPTNARIRTDQMDLFGAADEEVGATQELGNVPPESIAEEMPDTGLLTLYIRAHEGKEFIGTDLVSALNAVGMVHGEMDIFHHFGSGDLKCDTAVFQAANMFEPGTFELSKIEAFRTTGVALFMQLPGPLDGAVAFELLLNSAQRLSELVGGEVFASPRSPLSNVQIAQMRQIAQRYKHAGG